MSIYDTLNKEQRQAVITTEGPLLMLAGAGSGKTKSLTHRIAYLIEHEKVNPWNILAITFTNKAAQEMRERVDDLVGYGSEDIWVSTFHAMCSRILRRHIDLLGYDRNFTIYDASDQKSLMKEILKEMNIDTKQFPEKSVLSEISGAKDKALSPTAYKNEVGNNYRGIRIAEIYERYQQRLKKNNALDFDDLLLKTVELFESQPEVLDSYQERFRYIMVDEYQDTNTVQFLLVSQLAKKYRNLCVVGDDDQSIYRFRGANIYNILNFEKVFPDAKVIKLEQNYRSTKNILDAANGVIKNNQGRKEKKLWTENDAGELVHFKQYDSEYDEAEGVVRNISFLNRSGVNFEDMAILYRTNAQSRIFEEKLRQRGIPYSIVRGISFYDRKEVKDL
ncbi:MAG: UvrD-helicase domain-containing protein, partial [Lachnospiraceae bacterium]|nr:UvrD-helicase domain-containing protein [Lachnospiraceae bacterium]